MITAKGVREEIAEAAKEIAEEIKVGNVVRDEPHDAIFEATDDLFGNFVQSGRISDYTIEDLKSTVQECAVILGVAEEDAWVADDSGLWEGLTYGILASIAFFSLENCLWQKLRDMKAID